MRDFFKGFKFKIIVCAFALVLGVVIYAAVSGGFLLSGKYAVNNSKAVCYSFKCRIAVG